MERSIIITDLTRFKPGNPDVCIAGIDQSDGECIRPVPYLAFKECLRLRILPGGILKGDFTPGKAMAAPHTEDHAYKNLKFGGACSGEEFRQILVDSCFAGVEEGFGVALPPGEKVIPVGNPLPRSLITVRARRGTIEIIENDYQPGSIRIHFTDESGRRHRFLPITDLGFHDYAQQHRERRALADLNREVTRQPEVFLRIGLSRSHRSPQGKEGYWLQANGIYTFPRKLSYIRTYPT